METQDVLPGLKPGDKVLLQVHYVTVQVEAEVVEVRSNGANFKYLEQDVVAHLPQNATHWIGAAHLEYLVTRIPTSVQTAQEET